MIISRHLKTIDFVYDLERQELSISTNLITKRNFFPLKRFMTRIEQRMWGRKIKRGGEKNKNE